MTNKLDVENKARQFARARINQPFAIEDFIKTLGIPKGYQPSEQLLHQIDYYLCKDCIKITPENNAQIGESQPSSYKEYYLYNKE